MAKQYATIEPHLRKLIEQQKIFFTATATQDSRINLSPKGLDGLRIVDETTAIYLDVTGSGNETAAHLRADGRMTIMVCTFEDPPMILRLYGMGVSHLRGSSAYEAFLATHFDGMEKPGARQIVELKVSMVQTSCGYGVPLFDYQGERDTLVKWAERKGETGIADYWAEKNLVSIDGLPTGFDTIVGARGGPI